MRPDGVEVTNAGGDKPSKPPAFQIIVLVSILEKSPSDLDIYQHFALTIWTRDAHVQGLKL